MLGVGGRPSACGRLSNDRYDVQGVGHVTDDQHAEMLVALSGKALDI